MHTTTRTVRTSRREDLITIAFGTWMMVGLVVDAFSHSTDSSLETFWTWSHAAFYSGFIVTAAWVVHLCLARREPTGWLLDWAPPGYRLAFLGLGIFALGGIGDAGWHTVFGVETGVDALLSPTHLLLFVGMFAIVSSPFRAAWNDVSTPDEPSFGSFFPALLSMTFSTTLVAFFFEYVWLPTNVWIAQTAFESQVDRGEKIAVLGVVGAVIATIVLMTGPIVASRRWRLPFGSVTAIFVVTNALLAFGFDNTSASLLPPLLAGIVADATLARSKPRWVFLTAPPIVLWFTFYFQVVQTGAGLGWPPEIWGGSVVFAVLASFAIDQIMRAGETLATVTATRPDKSQHPQLAETHMTRQ
ncbi:hypothetical protein MNBD_ACTINO02-2977 [hydrothermal vent metagenome]|uniref:Uncharacterized protein n=1 Tax=hydrothermal vent metagenome TaxID=652676 RepID=A0A3B0RM77_9ZZZZ